MFKSYANTRQPADGDGNIEEKVPLVIQTVHLPLGFVPNQHQTVKTDLDGKQERGSVLSSSVVGPVVSLAPCHAP